MPDHKTATREEWDSARADLLKREKEITRLSDAVAEQRKQLPWLKIDKDYTFQTADGPRSLSELFDGRSQLVVYHLMFGPDYEFACPVCSSIADSFNGVVPHLAARDATMIAISRAPIEKLVSFQQRMGWSFNWASSSENDFNWDFNHSVSLEQASKWVDPVPPVVAQHAGSSGADPAAYVAERPGLSVFVREGDDVYQTYASTARGLEVIMTYYGILDRVPGGRGADDPAWLRHHDRYEHV